ncbi:MAG: NFYB/HAP3 family transcription factor subunit [Thaumarchaeota archaeon]|nr:NFYB/HAP3 family transcription factor subunit [Candidatus Geocrenenecus arthurdayi]MCL7388406.1 NFYB/HAP3 family transcription factor subunit [Candidatus Geocrenenecus arthurdayi]MCL7390734.1 NFYB/HAP3 family transcription factor subunit [Candidatus Geocrenenecus arthurdayi]MCL7395810.1 NFYB/HAP3 family transcription factor subunit [Candidatus Geocrenenecus arthurdayi]MCL7402072.1 NFYB/HAP3 family transcription factor subunit [Candidatus Geocrenenecus arthurdayi]
MSSSELSLAPIHRLIKKAGAARASEDAAEELRKILEDVAVAIAKEALSLAQYAGRRTVKREDIERAAKTLLRGFYT